MHINKGFTLAAFVVSAVNLPICGAGIPGMEARREFRTAIAAGGERAKKAISEGLTNEDPFIRRGAVWEWYVREGAKNQAKLLAFLERLSSDSSDEVVSVVVDLSKAVSDVSARNRLLGRMLEHGSGEFQKKCIASAFQFPFQRENVALSADPGNDHLMVKAWGLELPKRGWKFRLDPTMIGHLAPQRWFSAEYVPDGKWLDVSVPAWFESYAGVSKDYNGVVWYVLDFDLPKKPDVGKVDDVTSEELAFSAVDEEAWVWLNGQYIGQHCEGLNGWNRPFRFDIKREVRWGARNRLVVRVSDTAQGGGIHKPVSVEVMK